jgi:hypothetical protein
MRQLGKHRGCLGQGVAHDARCCELTLAHHARHLHNRQGSMAGRGGWALLALLSCSVIIGFACGWDCGTILMHAISSQVSIFTQLSSRRLCAHAGFAATRSRCLPRVWVSVVRERRQTVLMAPWPMPLGICCCANGVSQGWCVRPNHADSTLAHLVCTCHVMLRVWVRVVAVQVLDLSVAPWHRQVHSLLC